MVYLLCNNSMHKLCMGKRYAAQTLFIHDIAVFMFSSIAFDFGLTM